MTDSQAPAAPLADPGPPPPPPSSLPGGWDRFFAWVRGIGLSRTDGWIGGVCAGIAARIGIDPIIVRGVFVVAALFGLPMFLVYAVGWALLPDLEGRIHLQELTRRRFDPAMVGIGLMLLVGFFPVVPWFFAGVLPFGFLVPSVWFEPTPFGVLGTFVVVAAIGGLIYLLVRSSRRTPTAGAPDPRTASADQTAAGSSAHVDSGVD
ncbi:MAG: PspC domain-containing protein, partial [Microbacterium sp.]